MILKGFKFGMILQLAIGPICMFVLNTALNQGFWQAQQAVLGTAVTDATEIVLAILGVGLLLNKSLLAKRIMKVCGVLILIAYGLSSILSVFEIQLLPTTTIPLVSNYPFVQAVLLALSNPLTVVFWASVFSAKVLEEKMQPVDLRWFALGCVLSTLVFLTGIAVIASLFSTTIPPLLIKIMNFLVGGCMLFFAYKNAKINVNETEKTV